MARIEQPETKKTPEDMLLEMSAVLNRVEESTQRILETDERLRLEASEDPEAQFFVPDLDRIMQDMQENLRTVKKNQQELKF